MIHLVSLLAGLLLAAKAEATMIHATGSFEVTLTPAAGGVVGVDRMTMAKTFTGGLVGSSHGEFLSAGDPARGAAGYVAIERVEGSLDGHAGSFALLQLATMAGAAQVMHIVIAPGSGTGALAAIVGSMTIHVTGGKHSYEIDYDLGAR